MTLPEVGPARREGHETADAGGQPRENLERPFAVRDLEPFETDRQNAGSIRIIGDNAGETVFDKVLAEELPHQGDVLFAVRDRPIPDDVTVREAHAVHSGPGQDRVVLERAM
ncbi:MAG: ARMT1-like domain-containing protein [Actinomycetota bacterium]|nr:ARMT1-like domain-containing protein [Actinomycetota bacterium]